MQRRGLSKGIEQSSNQDPIISQFVADDSTIFLKADAKMLSLLLHVLQPYYNALGSRLNVSKSTALWLSGRPTSGLAETLSFRDMGVPIGVDNTVEDMFRWIRNLFLQELSGRARLFHYAAN